MKDEYRNFPNEEAKDAWYRFKVSGNPELAQDFVKAMRREKERER